MVSVVSDRNTLKRVLLLSVEDLDFLGLFPKVRGTHTKVLPLRFPHETDGQMGPSPPERPPQTGRAVGRH